MPGLGNRISMAQFINDNGVGEFPHVPDSDGTLWGRFDVSQQSTYVYVNDDGTVTTTGYGSLREDVEQLIAD